MLVTNQNGIAQIFKESATKDIKSVRKKKASVINIKNVGRQKQIAKNAWVRRDIILLKDEKYNQMKELHD